MICSSCNGKGVILKLKDYRGWSRDVEPCPACGGMGQVHCCEGNLPCTEEENPWKHWQDCGEAGA